MSLCLSRLFRLKDTGADTNGRLKPARIEGFEEIAPGNSPPRKVMKTLDAALNIFSDDQTEMLDFFAKKSVTKRCVQWTGRVRRSTMNIGPLHRHSSYLNDQNTIELLNRTWSLVALHWT